jgi:GxxExxY protein
MEIRFPAANICAMAHTLEHSNAEHRNTFTGYHYALTDRIIRIFQDVAQEMGTGFTESIYRRALCAALDQDGLQAEQQFPIPIDFRGIPVGGLVADVLVDQAVLLQLEVAEEITRQSENKLMQYLSHSSIEVGLLLAFGRSPRYKCVLMTNQRKTNSIAVPNIRTMPAPALPHK